MADLIGQCLGHYEIVSLLGEGGMAAVYRARQQSVKSDVAIKVIKHNLVEKSEFIRRFEREARIVQQRNKNTSITSNTWLPKALSDNTSACHGSVEPWQRYVHLVAQPEGARVDEPGF